MRLWYAHVRERIIRAGLGRDCLVVVNYLATVSGGSNYYATISSLTWLLASLALSSLIYKEIRSITM